jgi:hypothetical protein
MLVLAASIFLLQAPELGSAPPPPPPPPAAQVRPAPPAPPAPPVRPANRNEVARVQAVTFDGELLRGEWPADPSGKRITLDSKQTIDDAVAEIGKAAGWSVATNTGRLGDRMLLLRLKDVPVEEALRAVLAGSGLVATRRGTIVAVAPGLGPVKPPQPPRPLLTGFDKPTGRLFTGDFDDIDGRDALLEVGRKTGLSISLPPGTHGKVTATFKDAPVEDVLRAILSMAGLTAERQGNVVMVTPRAGTRARFADAFSEIGEEIERLTDDATRSAEREARIAERAARLADGGSRPDRESVGSDVVVEPGQTARDVSAVRGNVTLRPGAEAREVVAVLGSVTLEAGASARQVVAIGGDVHVGPGAAVEKDAVAIGGRVLVDPAGDVGGQKVTIGLPGTSQFLQALSLKAPDEGSSSGGWALAKWVAQFGVMLLLGFLLVTFFPRRVEAVAASLLANPAKSVLAGLLGLLAQPLLSLLLVVTIVGIPLLVIQVLGLGVAYLMGVTAVAVLIGRAMPTTLHRGTGILQLAVGLALVLLAFAIPFVGWMLWATLVMATFGAVLRTRFGHTPVLETVAATSPPPAPPPAPPAAPPPSPYAPPPPPPYGG